MSSVSIAIATYNRAAMVRQAVEAALAQTAPPLEIVVVDDASTDTTWEVLQELAASDERVRVFRRERNSGGVDNWNFAIAQTRGGYIAWCSDDDRHLPDHLEASAGYLETHPEVGLVHSGFIDALETGSGVACPLRFEPRPLRFGATRVLSGRGLPAYLLRYYDWPFHPSTIVMRREVWERVGPFDPAYALADTDWFVRAVERFPAALLARHGVLNRRHPGNWSNRLGSARMQREIFEMVDRALGRQFHAASVRRLMWRALWRVNVSLRLGLTVWARLRGGHGDPACAAWRELAGLWLLPGRAVAAGEAFIRRWRAGRTPRPADARQSVSPL
jgi:glycosyltransferase involved in cell wall biosynthesis